MPPFDVRSLRKPGDVYMSDLRSDDIIIPVMGPTGSGKSSFINHVLNSCGYPPSNHAKTSDGFASCTQNLQHYVVDTYPDDFPLKGLLGERRLVLVDTPGFDDTEVSDAEIPRRIAVWLAASYGQSERVYVAGVVYIFPIYPNRITRNDKSNLKVFKKICGDGNLGRVILVTSRWDTCPPGTGERRERELKDNFWVDMLHQKTSNGAQIARLQNDEESSTRVIGQVVDWLLGDERARVKELALDVQRQIVDKKRIIPETSAAKELRKKLEELIAEMDGGNPQQGKERLRRLVSQTRELKIPLSRRIMSIFKLK